MTLIGATIGAYTITGIIGEGGMGVVYSARHALLDRPAAIKVLKPEMSREPELVGRFFNEARAITAIRHPGIVELYDYGHVPGGTAYIAMEYLVGESLRRRLVSERRLSSGETLALARQIANALAAAHASGIIHRDLKPDNVFLVKDPDIPTGKRIKLLDFGIAKLVSAYEPATGTNPKTRTGAVLGTPTYMSPEQVRGAPLDERADIYSLGCLMFEMMTGRPPFQSEVLFDLLQAHVSEPAPRIASLVTGVPLLVDELVMKMLVKDPNARIQKCEHVVAMLDEIEPGLATGAFSRPGLLTTLSGATSTILTPPPVTRSSRRGLWAVAGGMVAASAIAATLIIGLGGSAGVSGATAPPPPPPPVEPAPVHVETKAVPPVLAPEPPATPAAPAIDAGAGSAAITPAPPPPGKKPLKRPPAKRPGKKGEAPDEPESPRDAAYNPFANP